MTNVIAWAWQSPTGYARGHTPRLLYWNRMTGSAGQYLRALFNHAPLLKHQLARGWVMHLMLTNGQLVTVKERRAATIFAEPTQP